ncbi:tetratricopeptide repeat protein [Psychrobacter cibarius]|uniref:tetratricopeptide repeat protein n=2 Tax=Psychrobacter cibarius TaxID=282669 RepID=UPI0018DFEC4D|nr:tetratricopeptide repeat protein [Psychrobacter cibarius]
MFGIFNKKKVNDPVFLKRITEDGISYAAERFSSILMRDSLPTGSLAHEFVMQELDGARQGDKLSVKFVENSGVPESRYKGSLKHDTPELDKAQEFMQMITSKLYPRMDIIVPLRIEIVKNIMEAYGIGQSGFSKKTPFEQFKEAAERGDVTAQVTVGLAYREGIGASQDYYKAFEWFKKAAEQGEAEAQSHLGHLYENGYGVEKNENKAVEWYLKSANQGYANAQYNIGVMYYFGAGVPKNITEAVKWFLKAANKGNSDAQYNLGTLYKQGNGVAQNSKESLKWFKKAAEQGDVDAQAELM